MNELWDLWFPNAGATGLSFARCRVGADAAADRVLVHAAPRHLEVVVRNDQGDVVAEGRGLRRGAPGPMSLLLRDDATIRTAGPLAGPGRPGPCWSSCRVARPAS